MRKNLKLFSKKGICLVLAIIMVALCFATISSVLANSYGEGDKSLKVDVSINNDDETNFDLKSVTVNEENWTTEDDEYLTEDGIYTVVFTVEKKGDRVPAVRYNENWTESIVENVVENGNDYTFTLNVTKPETENHLQLNIYGQEDNRYSVDFGTAEWVIDGVTVTAVAVLSFCTL